MMPRHSSAKLVITKYIQVYKKNYKKILGKKIIFLALKKGWFKPEASDML
jgi:hypothetical protein